MRLVRAVVVGGCLVGLAACGGGGGGGSGGGGASSGPLTKPEYIKQGDEICLRVNNEVKNLPAPTSPTEVAALLDRTIAANDAASGEFRALRPPPDGQAVHAAVLKAVNERTTRERQALDAVRRGDFTAMQSAMQDALTVGERSLDQARAYGFTVCGTNPS